MIRTANDLDVGILWDAILNHKAWADRAEEVVAVKCDPLDRLTDLTKPAIIKGMLCPDHYTPHHS
jgi:alpha-amylase